MNASALIITAAEARAMDPALEAPAVLRGKGFLPTAEGEKPEGCEVRHG